METTAPAAAPAPVSIPTPFEGITVRQCLNSGIAFLRKVYRTSEGKLALQFAQAWAPRTEPPAKEGFLSRHKAKGVGGKPITATWFAEGTDTDGDSIEEKTLTHLEALGIEEGFKATDERGAYNLGDEAVTLADVFGDNISIDYAETTEVEKDKDGNVRAVSPFSGKLARTEKNALARTNDEGQEILLTHEGNPIYSFTQLSDQENVLGLRTRLPRDQDQEINLPVTPATPTIAAPAARRRQGVPA